MITQIEPKRQIRTHRAQEAVILSHPSRVLNAYQAALAFQEKGLLRSFETGIYYKENSISRSILSLLPPRIAARIRRELERRVDPALQPGRIQPHPFWDLISTLSGRIALPASIPKKLMSWRNERFDQAVARRVLKERPAAVYCYDTAALRTFKACERTGTIKLLEQVIGHCKVGFEVLAQESELQPDFADSMEEHESKSRIEHTTEEVLSADYVFAPSDYVKQTLLSIGCPAERIITLPYGVDTQKFVPAATRPPRPFRILFAGQITQRKGIKYLLEAYKHLSLPDAELILLGTIVGSGKGLHPYEGLFKHQPSVPHAQVREYFQQADILVFPSIHEGSALVVYEALACGLPVITTPNAGSIVRDGEEGFIVPIRDIAALEDTILRLYKNPELRLQMAQRARQRAEQFTWTTYRSKLADTIEKLIEQRQGREG